MPGAVSHDAISRGLEFPGADIVPVCSRRAVGVGGTRLRNIDWTVLKYP